MDAWWRGSEGRGSQRVYPCFTIVARLHGPRAPGSHTSSTMVEYLSQKSRVGSRRARHVQLESPLGWTKKDSLRLSGQRKSTPTDRKSRRKHVECANVLSEPVQWKRSSTCILPFACPGCLHCTRIDLTYIVSDTGARASEYSVLVLTEGSGAVRRDGGGVSVGGPRRN